MKLVGKHLPPKVNADNLRDHFKSTYKLAGDQIEIMLTSCVDSLTTSISALNAALDGDDSLGEIERWAHNIKGLLLNMGEKQWADLARELEMAAADSEERDYRSMIKDIQHGVEDIV